MPVQDVVVGERGRVRKYIRANGRCPADDFLDGCEKPMRKRFLGAFNTIVQMGASYRNDQRFKDLKGDARPLWEFKEHDHRLYCVRNCMGSEAVEVVLLNGWVKDKKGKGKEEASKINTAITLYREYLEEQGTV